MSTPYNDPLYPNELTITEQNYIWTDSPIINKLNEYLISTYGVCYNKGYKIFIDEDNYTLYLDLNNPDRPTIIAGQFESEEDFTNYLIKEMRRRGLFRNEYFILYATDENGKT